jgi:hypothetical protein
MSAQQSVNCLPTRSLRSWTNELALGNRHFRSHSVFNGGIHCLNHQVEAMKHSSDEPPVVLGGFTMSHIPSDIFAVPDDFIEFVAFNDGAHEPLFERAGRLCCIHNGIWYIMRAKR